MKNIDPQMSINMKVCRNPYSFAHKYSGWIRYQSSKACGVTNKNTLDVADENILKCS